MGKLKIKYTEGKSLTVADLKVGDVFKTDNGNVWILSHFSELVPPSAPTAHKALHAYCFTTNTFERICSSTLVEVREAKLIVKRPIF